MIVENVRQTWSFSSEESDLALEKWESGNFEFFPQIYSKIKILNRVVKVTENAIDSSSIRTELKEFW